MSLYKNFDNKIMKKYPALWETKAHFYLPLIWMILLVLFAIGFLIEINLDEYHDVFEYSPFLFVPAIILMVFWVISAVKYNVFKSGGKTHLGHDYLHFFIYLTVIVSISQIPFAPMYGFHQKAKISFDKDAVLQEKDALNKGYSVLTWSRYDVHDEGNGNYTIRQKNLVSTDFNNYWYNYSDEEYRMDKSEMIIAINQFKESVYRLTDTKLQIDAKSYVEDNMDNSFDNSYEYRTELDPIESYFGNIQRMGNDFLPKPFNEEEPWLFIIGLSTLFSIFLWMFKRNSTREFIFGVIGIAVNPPLTGLVFLLIFGILDVRGHDEDVIIPIILLIGLCFYGVMAVVKYFESEKSWFGVLSAMVFQFYAPITIMISLFMYFDRSARRNEITEALGMNSYSSSDTYHLVFWICLVLAILLIIPMKALYKKQWYLPNKK